jgi:hypothetical protein
LTRSGASRCWIAAGLLACLGCASSYYDEYRSRHPGLQPGPPVEGASLEEVLAALHAPNPVETVEVEIARLGVFETGPEAWTDVSFEAIRRGDWASNDAASYAVLVSWRCVFSEGLREDGTLRSGYYLLPDNRLAARDHYSFRDRCAVRNQFSAARGAQIPLEREAMRRVAAWQGATRLDLAQAYRRGLAFVEAGRLDDARAMLVASEPGYRAVTSRLAIGSRAPDSIIEATRLRANLMRALGLEPK